MTKTPEQVRAQNRRRREKINAKMRELYQRIRRQCIEHYSHGSTECACCGESEYGFLTLDHINGDGSEDRKKYTNSIGIYRHLIADGYPEGMQVLCWNCNMAKGKDGICPHERDRSS